MFSPYSSLEASPAEASPQARYLPSPRASVLRERGGPTGPQGLSVVSSK